MTSYTNNIVDFRFIALAEDHVLTDWLRDDRICYDSRNGQTCLLYTSPSPRDRQKSRMPSSA